jgi:hypothetical protein
MVVFMVCELGEATKFLMKKTCSGLTKLDLATIQKNRLLSAIAAPRLVCCRLLPLPRFSVSAVAACCHAAPCQIRYQLSERSCSFLYFHRGVPFVNGDLLGKVPCTGKDVGKKTV